MFCLFFIYNNVYCRACPGHIKQDRQTKEWIIDETYYNNSDEFKNFVQLLLYDVYDVNPTFKVIAHHEVWKVQRETQKLLGIGVSEPATGNLNDSDAYTDNDSTGGDSGGIERPKRRKSRHHHHHHHHHHDHHHDHSHKKRDKKEKHKHKRKHRRSESAQITSLRYEKPDRRNQYIGDQGRQIGAPEAGVVARTAAGRGGKKHSRRVSHMGMVQGSYGNHLDVSMLDLNLINMPLAEDQEKELSKDEMRDRARDRHARERAGAKTKSREREKEKGFSSGSSGDDNHRRVKSEEIESRNMSQYFTKDFINESERKAMAERKGRKHIRRKRIEIEFVSSKDKSENKNDIDNDNEIFNQVGRIERPQFSRKSVSNLGKHLDSKLRNVNSIRRNSNPIGPNRVKAYKGANSPTFTAVNGKQFGLAPQSSPKIVGRMAPQSPPRSPLLLPLSRPPSRPSSRPGSRPGSRPTSRRHSQLIGREKHIPMMRLSPSPVRDQSINNETCDSRSGSPSGNGSGSVNVNVNVNGNGNGNNGNKKKKRRAQTLFKLPTIAEIKEELSCFYLFLFVLFVSFSCQCCHSNIHWFD